MGYIGIVWPKKHSPEVWSVPPVTPCICTLILLCPLQNQYGYVLKSFHLNEVSKFNFVLHLSRNAEFQGEMVTYLHVHTYVQLQYRDDEL